MDGARSQDGSQERVRSGHNLPMIRRQNQQDSPLGLDIGRGRKDSGMIPRFLAQASGSMEFPPAEQACKATRVCRDNVECGDGYSEFAMPIKHLHLYKHYIIKHSE